jgi:hypothetical protein
MSSSRDYDTLVAAHLLRSPTFAMAFGPLIRQAGGFFFGDFFLRDVVLYGLEHLENTGQLLHPAAIKVDVRLFGRDGASQDNYDLEIDRVWAVDESVLQRSQAHVTSRLVEETQARLLLGHDLHELCVPGSLGKLWELLEGIRTLGALTGGGARRFSEGLRDSLRDPPIGIPSGVPELDALLSGGGPCPGETLLWFGRYGIGKSITIHHSVRASALAKRLSLLWSLETSQKTTELRLAKGFLGWTDAQLRADPIRAEREYLDTFGDLPLYVHYSPPGSVTKAGIIEQLDRIEQDVGTKVELLAMDYSEKRAKGRDWIQVADAYQELREICGERKMVGMDVAQENTTGNISYSNLLKDADIGVQLTVTDPDEWRRRQRSKRDEDNIQVKIPTAGPVWGEVVRCREGVSGQTFELWVDRATGKIRSRDKGGEES